MPSTCEYFKIEEKEPHLDPENYDFDEDISQIFTGGFCITDHNQNGNVLVVGL